MGIPAALGVGASGLPNAGDQANAVLSGVIAAVGPGDPFAFRGPMNLAIWASFVTTLTTTANSLSASVASAGALAAGAAINSKDVPPGTTFGTFSGTSGNLALPAVTLQASQILSNGQVTLPPGSNVVKLVGATVTVPSNAEGVTLPAGATVVSVLQPDIAPSANSPGVPGIIQLSAAPTAVPADTAQHPLRFALGAAAITAGADAAAVFTGATIVYNGSVQLERSFDGGGTWIVAAVFASSANGGAPQSLTFGEPEKNVLYRLNCTALTGVAGTSLNYRISQTGGAAESLAIGPLSGG